MNIRVEEWCGYNIRFVEHNSEWMAVLKDICVALDLKTFKVSQRLDPDMMERLPIESSLYLPSQYNKKDDIPSKYNTFSEHSRTSWMLCVNELGIYEALYSSRRLEARKFRRWSAEVMQKLRKRVGLEGYEALRLTEEEVQDEIDHILDCLYFDEETGILMESVTVQGGDVEQVPFKG